MAGKQRDSSLLVKQVLIGGTTMGISATIVAPIDRVKLLFQVQAISKQMEPGKQYKGIVNTFKRLTQEQGMVSLWRGNLANVLAGFPSQILTFAFYHNYEKALRARAGGETQSQQYLAGNVVIGAAAGFTSLCVTYPFDFARTRMAVDIGTAGSREYTGLADCFRQTLRTDRVHGLYRGFFVSVQGIIVYRGAFFGFYPVVKSMLPLEKPSYLTAWLTAQIVVAISALTSYPFDTVRRRMMMQSGRTDTLYKNSFDIWRQIIRQEGVRAFYNGAFCVILKGLGSAVTLVAYESLKPFL